MYYLLLITFQAGEESEFLVSMFQSQLYLSHQTCSLLPWPSDCEKKGQVENGQCDLAVHSNVMQKYHNSSWCFVKRASVLDTEIGLSMKLLS